MRRKMLRGAKSATAKDRLIQADKKPRGPQTKEATTPPPGHNNIAGREDQKVAVVNRETQGSHRKRKLSCTFTVQSKG